MEKNFSLNWRRDRNKWSLTNQALICRHKSKKYVYFTMWGLEVSDLKGQIRRNTKTLTKTPV